jgi:hypothetical protein
VTSGVSNSRCAARVECKRQHELTSACQHVLLPPNRILKRSAVEIRQIDFPNGVREVIVSYDFGMASVEEAEAADVRAIVALDSDEEVCIVGKLQKRRKGGGRRDEIEDENHGG